MLRLPSLGELDRGMVHACKECEQKAAEVCGTTSVLSSHSARVPEWNTCTFARNTRSNLAQLLLTGEILVQSDRVCGGVCFTGRIRSSHLCRNARAISTIASDPR